MRILIPHWKTRGGMNSKVVWEIQRGVRFLDPHGVSNDSPYFQLEKRWFGMESIVDACKILDDMWGNLLRSVPWVSVWHRNMNFLTPFTFKKYLCMLTDILPQYLKIIMCKLPEFFGSQSRDVHFMVCHTLTFFFLNGVSLTQNCKRMLFFSCFVVFMYYDVNKSHSFIHFVISHWHGHMSQS